MESGFFRRESSRPKKTELNEKDLYPQLVQELKPLTEQEKELRRLTQEMLAERRREKQELAKTQKIDKWQDNKKVVENHAVEMENSDKIIEREKIKDLKNPIPLHFIVKKILKMRSEYQGHNFAERLFLEGVDKLEAELKNESKKEKSTIRSDLQQSKANKESKKLTEFSDASFDNLANRALEKNKKIEIKELEGQIDELLEGAESDLKLIELETKKFDKDAEKTFEILMNNDECATKIKESTHTVQESSQKEIIEKSEKNQLKLEELRQWVNQHHPGSNIISTEYVNAKTKLEVQCVKGHNFKTIPKSIKNGHWCQSCSEGVSERISRKIFEKIFNKTFPKSRPDWLVNNRENQMELDGYNKKLGVAFEYQGAQHSMYSDHFHRSTEDLKQRQADDRMKIELCEKNGVTLIQIPHTIKPDQMQDYITQQCRKKNVNMPQINGKINYRELDIYSSNSSRQLGELKEYIETQYPGSLMKSTKYINSETKIEIQCERGHAFEMIPANVKRGKWCPTCVGNKRLSINEMKEFVEIQHPGSQVISTEYINSKTKLEIRCKEGHNFKMTSNNIKSGRWCPECSAKESGLKNKLTPEKRQISLELLRNFVETHHPGSQIISSEYINALLKVDVQCTKGHHFKMTPANIKSGYWCRRCSAKEKMLNPDDRRKAFEGLKKVIETQHPGGQLISNEYINARTKVSVKCARGHTFEIIPNSIKRGHWCSLCAYKEIARKKKSK